MSRQARFTLVLSTEERRTIAALAERLERSQSDAVRYAVRKLASQELVRPNSATSDAAQEALKGDE